MIAYRNGIYQGTLQNGIKEGIGIFWWPTGSIYIGEWYKDMIHGEGIILINDNIIRAQFKNNKFHGLCVNYTQSEFYRFEYGQLNGKCLKGQTVSQYRRGDLIQIDTNLESVDVLLDEFQNRLLDLEEILDRNQCTSIGITETFLGRMKRGKQLGLGIENMFTTEKRIGIFHDQSLTNIGQIWMNGDIYTGGFKENKYDGLGCFFISGEMKMIQGIFQNGKCVEIKKKQNGDIEAYKILAEQTFQALQSTTIQQRVPIPYLQQCQFEVSNTWTQNSISQIPQSIQEKDEKDQTFLEVELDIQKEIEKIQNDQQTIEAKKLLYDVVNKYQDNDYQLQLHPLEVDQLQTFRNNPSVLEIENIQGEHQKSKFVSSHSQQTEYFHVNDSKQPSGHSCKRLPLQTLKNQNNESSETKQSIRVTTISARSEPYSQVLSSRKTPYLQ
ncbi:unnamed protein product (macronuclear) [Paramecium tetraurelia]|uniref:MORN repeat protein n=1 Tax=Paramecium tetraurelia TaxID=5888 RepID=A0D1S2_PARTE|nr:uncharacterized protein GSPATT00012513001 [Paramecium tetraurelia]CAK76989.1 unnamed protein product [Paramecium tetraurelia]|eukprot:XP_001444386.1 hypothetical protein (macronuclear) [Paramecium tetraurelia strain d4-2]